MNLDADIKRKETIRVSKKDLQKLLAENEHMAAQITELQTRLSELVEENRRLKLPPKPKSAPILVEPEDEPFPIFDPNIYFDGAHGLNK